MQGMHSQGRCTVWNYEDATVINERIQERQHTCSKGWQPVCAPLRFKGMHRMGIVRLQDDTWSTLVLSSPQAGRRGCADWTTQIRMALSVARATATDEYLPRFQQAMKQLAHCVAMLKTDARAVRHTDPSICHNRIVRKPTKRLEAGEVHLRASKA